MQNYSKIMDRIETLASTLSHDELLEITQSLICTLMTSDSLLSDLPQDIILEEIQSQIAVEHGQSITLIISREEEDPLKVIVPQNSTVLDLKKAIARHFEIYQKRKGIKVKVSWKYIWKTYALADCEGIILDNDLSPIEEYGVTNKMILTFKKKRNRRNKM